MTKGSPFQKSKGPTVYRDDQGRNYNFQVCADKHTAVYSFHPLHYYSRLIAHQSISRFHTFQRPHALITNFLHSTSHITYSTPQFYPAFPKASYPPPQHSTSHPSFPSHSNPPAAITKSLLFPFNPGFPAYNPSSFIAHLYFTSQFHG